MTRTVASARTMAGSRNPAFLSGVYINSNSPGSSKVSLSNISALQNLTAVTIEAWVYFYNFVTSNSGRVFDYSFTANNGYIMNTTVSGTIVSQICNGTTTVTATSSNISLMTWHKVEANWDGSNVRIFIDGNLAATTALSGGNTGNGGVAPTIGNTNGGNRAFPGVISELRISNIARHTATYTPETAPLVADANTLGLYHFIEGMGTTTADSSSNANTGTLGGSPLPIWSSGKWAQGPSARTTASTRTVA